MPITKALLPPPYYMKMTYIYVYGKFKPYVGSNDIYIHLWALYKPPNVYGENKKWEAQIKATKG